MCGIVGLITKKHGGLYSSDLEFFQGMLVNDTQRGEDSTGAIMVSRDGTADSIKIASHPFHLFACDEWRVFKNKAIANGRILVGHNRKATQGAVISENAHPFTVGKICLVHNGTLRNYKKFNKEAEVDSHVIAQMFNDKPHTEVIPQIEGAFALVWYNFETEKLYMVRNEERPLCVLSNKDLIAFSSESWMAEGQFLRKGEKVDERMLLTPGIVYEFSLNGTMTQTKVELYKAPLVESNNWKQHNGYRAGMWDDDDYYGALPSRPTDISRLVKEAVNAEDIIIPDFQKYSVDDEVQVKIERVERELSSETNRLGLKAYGKVVELNKPEIDCVGWLHEDETVKNIHEWTGNPVIAKVARIILSSCGPSIWLKDLEIDDTVEVFNSSIGSWTWSNILDKESCSKCGSLLHVEEAKFTSVNLKSSGHRIHCHNCVQDSLPVGEVRNDFITRRNAALQDRKPISKSSDEQAESVILLPGTPSVH